MDRVEREAREVLTVVGDGRYSDEFVGNVVRTNFQGVSNLDALVRERDDLRTRLDACERERKELRDTWKMAEHIDGRLANLREDARVLAQRLDEGADWVENGAPRRVFEEWLQYARQALARPGVRRLLEEK